MDETSSLNPQGPRLRSLDALRGFDMFWIIGGAHLIRALEPFSHNKIVSVMSEQLHHVNWEGLHAYDVIFPLFVFVAGASAALSIASHRNRSPAAEHVALLRRLAVLFALGVLYNGGFSRPIEDMRWAGVLQRIAVCSFFVGLAHVHLSWRWRAGLFGALVVGYGLALQFIPIDGIAGSFEEGKNLSDLFDARFLPGLGHRGLPWDPEGILSTLPAVATGILGGFAAEFLLLRKRSVIGGVGSALLAAAVMAGCGWLLRDISPIIKKIWSPSYVLCTGGICIALLALFHLVVDRMRWGFWTHPFLWVGANPLLAYLAGVLLDMDGIVNRLSGGDVAGALGKYADTVHALLPLLLILVALRFLYRRSVFVRV